MKKSRSDKQIVGFLRHGEAGVAVKVSIGRWSCEVNTQAVLRASPISLVSSLPPVDVDERLIGFLGPSRNS